MNKNFSLVNKWIKRIDDKVDKERTDRINSFKAKLDPLLALLKST